MPSAADARSLATLGLRAWLALLLSIQLGALVAMALLQGLVPSAAAEAHDVHHPILAGLVLAAAISGLWSCRLARRALLCLHEAAAFTATTLSLAAVAPAVAVCAIAIIAAARHPLSLNAPVIVPVASVVAVSTPGPAADVSVAADKEADPQAGMKLYGNSCAACHGDAGQGVENVGPALAATEFLGSRSDAQMIGFLQVGRTPADADSRMGRAMPARGGNPALTDRDLADIVAHLRTLAPAQAEAAAGVKAAALPQWLAPPSPDPVAGVTEPFRVPTWQDIEGVQRPTHEPWHVDAILGARIVLAAGQGLLLLTMAALLLRTLTRRGEFFADRDLAHVDTGWSLVAMVAVITILAPLAGGIA
jgi:disulfide bond formation protein DsbB